MRPTFQNVPKNHKISFQTQNKNRVVNQLHFHMCIIVLTTLIEVKNIIFRVSFFISSLSNIEDCKIPSDQWKASALIFHFGNTLWVDVCVPLPLLDSQLNGVNPHAIRLWVEFLTFSQPGRASLLSTELPWRWPANDAGFSVSPCGALPASVSGQLKRKCLYPTVSHFSPAHQWPPPCIVPGSIIHVAFKN